ncbi:MAG: hydroxymethylbilane synthase [Lachnospiraceae bacterium]|nr:hydroxymethylbilane synthase [Lachnospiraceae bacterium]
MQKIKIGTRGSALALTQTDQVIDQLRQIHPEWEIEKVILRTEGDRILDRPLIDFGGKGVFINEFEEALLDGRIDLAVHSAKDMPMELADGLTIAGTLSREDARDVLVTRRGVRLSNQVPDVESTDEAVTDASIVIGTGSLRRQLQLRELYPDVVCKGLRGNVPTRLQKIQGGQCDGVVLAAAGLKRLGRMREPGLQYHCFSYEEMVPAGGQGIIAIEGRKGDVVTELVRGISDGNTYLELETERRVLSLLGADCHEAVGVISKIRRERISLCLIREEAGVIYRSQGEDSVANRLQLAKRLVNRVTGQRNTPQ